MMQSAATSKDAEQGCKTTLTADHVPLKIFVNSLNQP